MNNEQDIMSVCLAVVRGILTPEQARSAILGRTVPEPVLKTLHLASVVEAESAELVRLAPEERDRCLDLFKQLYDQPPAEAVLAEDTTLARMLVEQRVITQADAQESLRIQRELREAGVHPLPRIGELLVSKGFLGPRHLEHSAPPSPAESLPDGPKPRTPELQKERPHAVLDALSDPDNRFGRYVRTSLLGEGGSGEVWKCWDLELERWVALKFLKFEDTRDLARLREEAQIAARLSHPHIAVVHEITEAKGRTFIALEYVQGQTLERYPRTDHRVLVSIVQTVARAIQHAHEQGVIHRDLKPGNIMVDPSGRPVVMDFGLARSTTAKGSLSGQIQGTPSYMSPEQAMGGPVDPRSDVYSLGATLYDLLAGRPPFRGRSTLDILAKAVREEPEPLPNIAEDLRTIIFKCLMKEPARRYATAGSLAEDLRRWQEGEAILAHPPSLVYRLRKKASKWKAVIAVGLAGLFLAAGVAGWVVPRWLKADREGILLGAEKDERNKAEQALERARPHLDEGRKLQARLDRLLTSDQWTQENVHSLADQAEKEFDRALAIHPEYPDALLEMARTLQSVDRISAAVDYCTKAIRASKEYATAYLQRARLRLGQYEELRHSPERDEDALGNTDIRTLAGEIREDLREARAWSIDTQELLFANGALAFVDGDYEKAAPVLEDYARNAISDYRGWDWTGRAWLRVPGMEERAIRAFAEALRFRPRLSSLRISRGYALLQLSNSLRKHDEPEKAAAARTQAVEDFRRAREFNPSDPQAHLGLGEAALGGGEGILAAAHFSHALEIRLNLAPALLGRARARLRERDCDGAFADADQAIRAGGRRPDARALRGRARMGRGDLAGAREDLARALKEEPEQTTALIGWGELKWEEGDADGAIREYSNAARVDPGLAEAYQHRAEVAISRGDEERAAFDLAKAMALDPANPWIYYDLASAAGNRHEWAEALSFIRAGLARRPSHPGPFWQRLWLAHARGGDPSAAREELARLSKEHSSAHPDSPSSWINLFLLGKVTRDELLEHLMGQPKSLADARFYAAEKDLIEGKVDSAVNQFSTCSKESPISSLSRSAAAAELRFLTAPR